MQNSWCWKYSAISIYQVITATPCCCCAVMQVRRGILKSSGDKSTCCAQSALTFDSKLVNVSTETELEQFPNVSICMFRRACNEDLLYIWNFWQTHHHHQRALPPPRWWWLSHTSNLQIGKEKYFSILDIKFNSTTLYCIFIRSCWFSWGWRNFFVFKTHFQNGRLEKAEIFKTANSQKNFAKISGIKCRPASRPYRLCHITALRINQGFLYTLFALCWTFFSSPRVK